MNHLLEWIAAFQAKQTADIPQPVLHDTMCDLYKNHGRNVDNVTVADVRAALKRSGHRKYYEHVVLIHCKLTGVTPPRLTPSQEEQLKAMFLALQEPFERHVPKDRKNFLSYAYVLYKMCELNGWDALLKSFPMLKGRDKLHKQDEIYRKCCADLDWQFIPSV